MTQENKEQKENFGRTILRRLEAQADKRDAQEEETWNILKELGWGGATLLFGQAGFVAVLVHTLSGNNKTLGQYTKKLTGVDPTEDKRPDGYSDKFKWSVAKLIYTGYGLITTGLGWAGLKLANEAYEQSTGKVAPSLLPISNRYQLKMLKEESNELSQAQGQERFA